MHDERGLRPVLAAADRSENRRSDRAGFHLLQPRSEDGRGRFPQPQRAAEAEFRSGKADESLARLSPQAEERVAGLESDLSSPDPAVRRDPAGRPPLSVFECNDLIPSDRST